MKSYYAYIRTAPGIRLRYGFWPSKKASVKGTVLLLNGRTEFMEKHLETVRELNDRGLNVYSLDWRGQGGSTRELQNPHKGFVRRYEDYLNDISDFYREVFQRGAAVPIIFLAHSMGAHIALRYLSTYPMAADRVVLTSPMIDVCTTPFPLYAARLLTATAVRCGLAARYCFGASNYAFSRIRFENNRLTSDTDRFWAEHAELRAKPQLALGGVTWGWLSATFASIDRLTGDGTAERITTPLLMLCAENDRVVSNPAQYLFASRTPDCRFFLMPNCRHEILKENDRVRKVFWKEFDAFIGSEVQI